MCPVCYKNRLVKTDTCDMKTGKIITLYIPEPMYEYSYPDNPDYISPRCSQCIDIAMQNILL